MISHFSTSISVILAAIIVLSLAPTSSNLMNVMPANADQNNGSATKWSGEFESLHSEEGSQSGLSGSSVEKESGTMTLSIDSTGEVSGNGTGHFYYKSVFINPGLTCTVTGDSAFEFTFIGIIYGQDFDSLELGTYRSSSPTTFAITDACNQTSYDSPLYPITLSGCCLIPRVILKLENATGYNFHYFNSTTDGPSKTTTSVDIKIKPQSCQTSFKGAFEPVQAVWQDDDLFADKPGKQLKKLDDRHYIAELDMVANKPALLFGTKDDRFNIVLKGESTSTIKVPAMVRFTLEDTGGKKTIGEFDAGSLPLEGPCGDKQDIEAKIPASNGLPDKPFSFGSAGPYTIILELVEAGGKIVKDSQVIVEGNAVSLKPLKLNFIPAYLNATSDEEKESLVATAQELATQTSTYIPDYYPLPPGTVVALSKPNAFSLKELIGLMSSMCETNTSPSCAHDAFTALITSRATLMGWLGGTDKVILVLTNNDFVSAGADEGEAGEAFSNKVIFLNELTTSVARPNAVVAHELVHTLPFPWSSDQMRSLCGVDYHGGNVGNYGNGFQVTDAGNFAPAPVKNVGGIMGPALRAEWIEQCTYWHLTKALNTKADPELLGVRGWVKINDDGSGGSSATGRFDPLYSVQGEPDLDSNGSGSYALVFKDQAGRVLDHYNFNMTFTAHDGHHKNIEEFGYRVKASDGASKLELVDTIGTVLASKSIPNTESTAPTVTIHAPSEGAAVGANQSLDASWSGDVQNANLTYSAFLSADEGSTWTPLLIDSNASSAHIDSKLFVPGPKNILKVFVTDGFQSQSSLVHFAVAASAEKNMNQSNKNNTSSAPKSGCLIATAAFGSELAPQVQFLRSFRDERILSTVSGSNFMAAFNAWYYSFSPQVADYERQQPWLQQLVRVGIYPLLGILQVAEKVYQLVPGEYGSISAGIISSSLIGAVYVSPIAISAKRVVKKKLDYRFAVAIAATMVLSVLVSLLAGNAPSLTATSSLMVVSTMIISAIYSANALVRIFRYISKSGIRL